MKIVQNPTAVFFTLILKLYFYERGVSFKKV